MIAKLKGLLDSTGIDHAIIDVGGVGYLVGASSRTLAALGPVGEAVTIHTEMLVSDDAIRLVGFARAEERDWYRLLTHVQGVGSRVALAILSALEPHDLHRAIATGDKAMIARANGVGPKLALRIVTELKGKPLGDISFTPSGHGVHAEIAPPPPSVTGEAVSALLGLGVAEVNARRAVDQALIRLGEDADLSAVIRAALQELGR